MTPNDQAIPIEEGSKKMTKSRYRSHILELRWWLLVETFLLPVFETSAIGALYIYGGGILFPSRYLPWDLEVVRDWRGPSPDGILASIGAIILSNLVIAIPKTAIHIYIYENDARCHDTILYLERVVEFPLWPFKLTWRALRWCDGCIRSSLARKPTASRDVAEERTIKSKSDSQGNSHRGSGKDKRGDRSTGESENNAVNDKANEPGKRLPGGEVHTAANSTSSYDSGNVSNKHDKIPKMTQLRPGLVNKYFTLSSSSVDTSEADNESAGT